MYSFSEENYFNTFLSPSSVNVKGLLGEEITSVEKGRLSVLPEWNNGRLIKMFSEEFRLNNKTNDWYGEHAGKWMYSTALAVNRTGDPSLKNLLFKTADELIAYQDAEGYLGSYSPKQRITAADYTMHHRSWDVWNLTYMTLGFLEINRYFPNTKYLGAANKIGELLLKTFGDKKADITNYGTRHGFSATIVLEAAVELFHATNDNRYIEFGSYILRRINERENLRFLPMMEENRSLELIGDGKIYQSIWNMYAIAKFYEIQPDPAILTALQKAWNQITSFHLTPGGGPWGGVGKHLECFNSRVFFSPYGLVETCSTMSWIHFNRQMLRLTGEAKYAEEIEKSSYNELIGAKYTNGIDWNYHSFPNGSRHIANFNDCCPSSGTLALEELPTLIYSKRENGISCNIYTESEVKFNLSDRSQVKLIQKTNYPFQTDINLTVIPEKGAVFPIFIRIPEWANTTKLKINGELVEKAELKPGTFFKINRKWNVNDIVEISFPNELRVINKIERIEIPQSKENIYTVNWTAFVKGPLVYSLNGLIDGTEREDIIRFENQNPVSMLIPISNTENKYVTEYQLNIQGKAPMVFVPYYRTGDRKDKSWRLTWLRTK